jgi:hypothetical protein
MNAEALAAALAVARKDALEEAARVVEDMAAYYQARADGSRGTELGDLAGAIASTMRATLPHRIRDLAAPAAPTSGVPSGSREPINGNGG